MGFGSRIEEVDGSLEVEDVKSRFRQEDRLRQGRGPGGSGVGETERQRVSDFSGKELVSDEEEKSSCRGALEHAGNNGTWKREGVAGVEPRQPSCAQTVVPVDQFASEGGLLMGGWVSSRPTQNREPKVL